MNIRAALTTAIAAVAAQPAPGAEKPNSAELTNVAAPNILPEGPSFLRSAILKHVEPTNITDVALAQQKPVSEERPDFTLAQDPKVGEMVDKVYSRYVDAFEVQVELSDILRQMNQNISFVGERNEGDLYVGRDSNENPLRVDLPQKDRKLLFTRMGLDQEFWNELIIYAGRADDYPIIMEDRSKNLRKKTETSIISATSPELRRLIRGPVQPLGIHFTSSSTDKNGDLVRSQTIDVGPKRLRVYYFETGENAKTVRLEFRMDDDGSLTVEAESAGQKTTTQYSREALEKELAKKR